MSPGDNMVARADTATTELAMASPREFLRFLASAMRMRAHRIMASLNATQADAARIRRASRGNIGNALRNAPCRNSSTST